MFISLITSTPVHIISTLPWKLHVARNLIKVYSSLHSPKFYRKFLSTSLRFQLLKSLVPPHYYASIGLDKSRTLELQTDHSSWIIFITGNIPFIPTSSVNTYLTHKRLQLGLLSLKGWRYFLACLIYKIIFKKNFKYLSVRFKVLQFSALISRFVRLSEMQPKYVAFFHVVRKTVKTEARSVEEFKCKCELCRRLLSRDHGSQSRMRVQRSGR